MPDTLWSESRTVLPGRDRYSFVYDRQRLRMVGYQDNGPICSQMLYGIHQLFFFFPVQIGGDFVQDDYLGITQEQPDYAYELSFPRGNAAFG